MQTRWGPAALKVLRADSRRSSLVGEALLQLEANRAGAAPRPLAWQEWFIVSEMIPGPSLAALRGEGGIPRWAVLEALRAARALDAAGILHHEIHRPWRNVLYTTRKALIVDYESAGLGCGNVPKILAGLAAADHQLRSVLPTLRPLLREYRDAGCPLSVYLEVEDLLVEMWRKMGDRS